MFAFVKAYPASPLVYEICVAPLTRSAFFTMTAVFRFFPLISRAEADPAKFIHRNSFNIASMSFDPEIIYNSIKKYVPGFEMEYQVDPLRQSIADSWPNSLDDSCAREEWGWKPEFDLDGMTRDMLAKLKERFGK